MTRGGNIAAWVLAVFLAYVFAFAGGTKLLGNRAMVQEFARVGIGQWLRYFTGILEVSGAIGTVIPRFRFWAALQIATVMVGATVANLTVLHAAILAPVTLVLCALALTLAWLRRPRGVPNA